MMISDVVGDMLTRIRNGLKANKKTVLCPFSMLRQNVLSVLKEEGFIEGFEKQTVRTGIDNLEIQLKYFEGKPAIHELKRISTPGCRVYSKAGELPRIYNGLGIAVVSTSKGLMTDAKARQDGLGGEVLCSVF
ncbi:MAG: 30S ribosomal protein S8 [Alphaproteobacteria bacterium]|nr:30S ribosomal protein S8 [Alphaproteobacteria bacterium]MBN2780221.1 30S ribosomal protein S8 [Alphaproteobacteria bacterium]